MLDKMDMEKWTKDAVDMARSSIETGTKNFEIVQEQARKSLDFAMETTGRLQEQTRKAYDDWQKTVDQARRSYTDAVESGWNVISSAFNVSGAPQTKSSKEGK